MIDPLSPGERTKAGADNCISGRQGGCATISVMGARPERPHIAINMAMSADGKTSTRRRESFQMGSPHDKQLMNVLRARADAVVIGAGTLRVDGFPLIVRDAALVHGRLAKKKPPQPINAVMSNSLAFPLTKKFFHCQDTEKIVFTIRSARRETIERIERYADVAVLPGMSVSPKRVIDRLAKRGCAKILVEGGGAINYSFFKAGLVDELYVTLAPTIIGGSAAPTVVDGRGFLKNTRLRLELISAKRIENELFLHYRVIP